MNVSGKFDYWQCLPAQGRAGSGTRRVFPQGFMVARLSEAAARSLLTA